MTAPIVSFAISYYSDFDTSANLDCIIERRRRRTDVILFSCNAMLKVQFNVLRKHCAGDFMSVVP